MNQEMISFIESLNSSQMTRGEAIEKAEDIVLSFFKATNFEEITDEAHQLAEEAFKKAKIATEIMDTKNTFFKRVKKATKKLKRG